MAWKIDADTLRAVPLLATFSENELNNIILSEECRHIDYTTGQYILQQGERGQAMYFIEDGVVEIRINSINRRELTIGSLSQGDFFGEQALMPGSDGLRNASIRCLLDTRVFEIPRNMLANNSKESGTPGKKPSSYPRDSDDQDIRQMLENMSLFKSLSLKERYALIGSLELLYCLPGQTVITQQTPGDDLYIVLQGLMEVFLEPSPGVTFPITTLERGNHFGEQVLLPNNEGCRLTNVRAINAALLGRLPGITFKRLLSTDHDLCQTLQQDQQLLEEKIVRNSEIFP